MNPSTLTHHIATTFPAGVAFWTDVVKSLGGTYIAPNLPDPHAEKIEALMEEALAQGLLQEPQLGVLVATRKKVVV